MSTEGNAQSTSPAPPAAAARPIAIRTRGLTRRYEGKVALDRLDLDIHQGDIFGYIGPNGAGKTTTLRILAAILWPTDGSAQICGVDVVRRPQEIKALVGYMPDSFGVYENMTLGEYLDFFGSAYRLSPERRRRVIRDVLALTDLESKKSDLVSTLSRGMKQRACLARTLLHDPQVLLLDEPASGLDPRARIELRELLRELQRMGKTILISSHILSDLSTICSTVGIIESGKLVASGPVDEILKSAGAARQFLVDLLEPADSERAAALLEKQVGVSAVERTGRSLRLTLLASESEVAAIVEALVAAKVRVTAFREEVPDLEAAFLALTRGKLA